MYFVYILQCVDSTLYVGSTNNTYRKRLHEHNELKSGAHYTKIRRPVVLSYTEDSPDISAARKARIRKHGQCKAEAPALFEEVNIKPPEWVLES